MSLILAVEPDRRQAKQLSSVVRQHVRAEFVVAESGSAALAAKPGSSVTVIPACPSSSTPWQSATNRLGSRQAMTTRPMPATFMSA